MQKIFFIQPPRYKGKIFHAEPLLPRCAGIPAKASYLQPPIGLAYTAAYIMRERNVAAQIIDAQAEDLTLEETAEKAKDADFVIISASLPAIESNLELCKQIKTLNKDIKIGLIGTYASFFHKKLIKNSAIDFVVRGEPEIPLVNILDFFNEKRFDLSGLTLKHNGKIIVGPKAKLIENLDSLPFAARELLNYKKYYDILIKGKKLDFVISARGCPFRCNFCAARAYSKKYRARSAGNVLSEVREIQEEFGHDDITFFDDTFTINKRRILEICEGLKGLSINWRCLSRVDTVDREMLEKMYAAGCYQIKFGVESGSQRMLDRMGKGIKLSDVKKVFKICNEIGIETVAFFILGYPGETKRSAEKTIRFAEILDADFASFNLFTPLPGSPVFPNFEHLDEWSLYDFGSFSFCSIPTEELKEIATKAYKRFYLRPAYAYGRIKKMGFRRFLVQNIKFWLMREGVLAEKIFGKR